MSVDVAARLRVKRPYGLAMARRLGLYLNGRTFDWLHENEEKVFDLAPGDHVLQSYMDWATSEPLQLHLHSGETVEVIADMGRMRDWFLHPGKALTLRVR